ncbi:phosphoglycerate kinase [Candidatus Uabimicrobium sp. HlEnr_7]|uniref:phosphoglycerate kinase n=1 Tax=Candidatus Uabimicrobium helgolandensis TaxID=3095367 RepID=UPI003558196B
MQFYTIEDFKDKLRGKKVFVRVDTNTTLENGEMPFTSRIEQAFETVNKLTSYGAAVVLGAHNGRGGETSFVSLGPLFSMLQKQNSQIPKLLCPGNTYDEQYLGLNAATKNTIKDLQSQQILVLENLRFLQNETAKMDTKEFAQQKFIVDLVESGIDYYVLDGFSVAHRAHMSIVGFSSIPNIAGLAVEKELLGAKKIKELLAQNQTGDGRVTFIFGGAKIQDYFQLMENALQNNSVSKILPGGLFSSLCLILGGYDLGKPSCVPLEKKDSKGKSTLDYKENLQKLLDKHRDAFVMPVDVAYLLNGERIEYLVDEIPQEAREKGAVLDIGEKTIQKYKEVLQNSNMAYWKGPLGAFDLNPLFAKGSQEILGLLRNNSNIFSVMGGGDTGQMLSKFDTLPSELSYVSLSGGALIQILAGNDLPGILALEKSFR